MGFKRCYTLNEIQEKLTAYEYMLATSSSASHGTPYSSTAFGLAEALDMLKVLTREVELLKKSSNKVEEVEK